MADVSASELHDDGTTLTRGARTFGAWWVGQPYDVTADGFTQCPVEFFGSVPGEAFGWSDVRIEGIAAARAFAAELVEACDYAQACLTPTSRTPFDSR